MSIPEIDVEQITTRTYRYWYDDGLVEGSVGIVFLLLGLLLASVALLPEGSPWRALPALGFPLVLIGGGLALNKAVRTAKERIIYPRTGYVAYHRSPKRHRPLRVAVGAVTGALVGGLLVLQPATLNWLPLMEGVIIGAWFFWLGHKVMVGRFQTLGVIALGIGALASLMRLDDEWGMGAFFIGFGLALILSGALAFLSYLRHSQPLEERDHES
ncbi:MAG: hypothetical protein GX605_13590 [Chloroflexi bacterium]|nr:hypothetical protein [Chloroflexota bacterium]